MMLGFRQKQLLCLAGFLLVLCGASDLWAPGPGDDEASAAPTLKRKRSDDDVASSASKEQPEKTERPAKKRRLDPGAQTPDKGKKPKASSASPTDSQKSATSHQSARSEPVMSEVLALPEGQIHADARRDISFKKLMDDKVVLVKFLELFVPECKVGVEEVETLGGLSEYTPSGDRRSLENFYVQITDGQRFSLKKPVMDDALTLFPHGNTKKWDPTFFESFTDRQWFLSILRHAQDFTAERLESLKPYIDQKPFVKSMFESLKYKVWQLEDKTTYKTETQELQRVYGATFLIAEDRGLQRGLKKGREEGEKKGQEEGKLSTLARLIRQQMITFEQAKELLSESQVAQLKELVSAEQQETATTDVQPPTEPDSTTS